jgi:hypothetical protein
MLKPREKSLERPAALPDDGQDAISSPPTVVRGNLAQFFAESPLAGSGLELERPRDFGRDIEL